MNRENAIQIALKFTKGWEKLASTTPNKTSYFKSPDSQPNDAVVYAYPDGKGYSIGWGTYNNLHDGTKITGRNFNITKQRSDYEIETEMRKTEGILFNKITRELTDEQYAAILDYSYNAGAYSLSKNYPNILDAINNGEDISMLATAAITDSGSGKVLTNLKNRRKDELQLYNGNYSQTYSYYLKNSTTINYSVIGLAVIGIAGYVYYLKKKKVI